MGQPSKAPPTLSLGRSAPLPRGLRVDRRTTSHPRHARCLAGPDRQGHPERRARRGRDQRDASLHRGKGSPARRGSLHPTATGDQLRSGCERWMDWVTRAASEGRIQLIARMALAHCQFETLHPFTDSNGRIGRLAAVLQMLQEGALCSPVRSVSPWLKDHADEYRDHLLSVSRSGDWAP